MQFEFHVFKVPVRVRAWFVITAFALGLVYPEVGGHPGRLVAFMAVLMGSIVLHELGHAIPGLRYGWKPRIELVFAGGVTLFEKRSESTRARRMGLLALGPILSLSASALGFAALTFADPAAGSLLHFTLEELMIVNAVWGGVNLVPILPLDGGQLAAEALSAYFPVAGRRVAAWISIVLCIGVAAAASYLHFVPLVLVGLLFAWRNHRMIGAERSGYERGSGVTSRDLAYVALTRSDAPAVVDFAQRAVLEATDQAQVDEANYLLAWGRFLSGDASGARATLDLVSANRNRDFALEGAIAHDLGDLEEALTLFEQSLPKATPFVEPRMVHAIVETGRFGDAAVLFDDALGAKFSPRGIAVVQRAAFDGGHDEASAGIGEALFRRTRDASVAFLVACARGRQGRVDDAFTWLRSARERGFSRAEVLDTDPALAALRERPEWGEVRASFDA